MIYNYDDPLLKNIETQAKCIPISLLKQNYEEGAFYNNKKMNIKLNNNTMTIQELATISQYNVGVKILIMNNNFLGMVRQWQQLFFDNRYSFTEMKNPNFNKITDGYRIKNKKLEKREDLDKVIKEFIEFDGPYLLNVIVEKEENVFPMVPSGESVSNIRLE